MTKDSRNFNLHPRARFDAYLEGKLSFGAAQRVRKHLHCCSECSEEVRQRATALNLVQQRDEGVRPHFPEFTTIEHPVMDDNTTPGWKVVTGLGVVVALVLGFVATVWVLGGDGTNSDAVAEEDKFLPSRIELSPMRNSLNGTSQSNLNAESGVRAAGNSTANDRAEGSDSNGMSVAQADLYPQGRQVLRKFIPSLRSYGWNIPRENALGVQLDSAVVQRGSNWMEIATVLTSGSPDDPKRIVVRECRQDADGQITGCPTPEISQGSPLEMNLGYNDQSIKLYRYDDGTWTALMSTENSSYRVDSDTSDSLVTPTMQAMAMSESARLSAGTPTTSNMDRFQRGWARLFGEK